MMERCYKAYSKHECDATENARVAMNLRQAQIQHNYTEIGFKKMKAPPDVWNIINTFYQNNKGKETLENWPRGNTYVNHWDSPSYMINFEDGRLRGAGSAIKNQIWAAVKPYMEEWTGKAQKPTSLYGIRVYKDQAVLATHLDRLPLVSSCIVNVDQDVNEPWYLEVYDHSGKAHNVTMEVFLLHCVYVQVILLIRAILDVLFFHLNSQAI